MTDEQPRKRDRLPAQWEPQARVWVTRPHNAQTWPGCLDEARQQFDYFVGQLSKRVEVADIEALGIATNDSWIRDFGPVFVLDEDGKPSCHDFRFNSWGGKYPPWDADDRASTLIADRAGVSVTRHRYVLEGGAIDTDGAGTLLAGERCLLDPARNPGMTRDLMHHILHDALGIERIIWLDAALHGDDTDGHVDNIARFIGPQTIAAVRAAPDHHDDRGHAVLERCWQQLAAAHDRRGQPLNLVALPAPQPPLGDYPASYANFLICNGAIFVPVFGQPTDDQALAVLNEALAGFQVIPIPCDQLIVGLGGLHCLTMPQPVGDPQPRSPRIPIRGSQLRRC